MVVSGFDCSRRPVNGHSTFDKLFQCSSNFQNTSHSSVICMNLLRQSVINQAHSLQRNDTILKTITFVFCGRNHSDQIIPSWACPSKLFASQTLASCPLIRKPLFCFNQMLLMTLSRTFFSAEIHKNLNQSSCSSAQFNVEFEITHHSRNFVNSRFRRECYENSYPENKSLVQNWNREWSLCFWAVSP
jgi:hypothetical protein